MITLKKSLPPQVLLILYNVSMFKIQLLLIQFFNTVIFLMMFSFCKGANVKTRCNANDASASKPATIDVIFGVLNCSTPGKL